MNKKTTIGVAIIAIVAIVGTATTYVGFLVLTPGVYDNFTKCLTEKGATVYTAQTCVHCGVQKEAFGRSLKHLNVIECDPRFDSEEAKICAEKGITSVPTWEFQDGTVKTGVQTMEFLAEKTQCQLPSEEPVKTE